MQNTHIFKPNEWMWKTIDPNSKERLIKSLAEPSDEFRKTRDVFIKSCIKMVFNQHAKQSVYIDEFLSKQVVAGNEKRCIECGCESDVSDQICRNCGGKFTKEIFTLKITKEIEIDPYASLSQYSSKLPNISSQTGEPDFINPNGYHNIIQVIQSIGFRSGIRQYGQGN